MKRIILGLAMLAVTGAALLLAAEKYELPAETAKLKPGPGAELAIAQCLLCHSADYISTQPPLSRTAWAAAVMKMRDKYGAPINTNTIPEVVDYLTRNYGTENLHDVRRKVNVP
jgi:mono/diheme cytochrome c family protein